MDDTHNDKRGLCNCDAHDHFNQYANTDGDEYADEDADKYSDHYTDEYGHVYANSDGYSDEHTDADFHRDVHADKHAGQYGYEHADSGRMPSELRWCNCSGASAPLVEQCNRR